MDNNNPQTPTPISTPSAINHLIDITPGAVEVPLTPLSPSPVLTAPIPENKIEDITPVSTPPVEAAPTLPASLSDFATIPVVSEPAIATPIEVTASAPVPAVEVSAPIVTPVVDITPTSTPTPTLTPAPVELTPPPVELTPTPVEITPAPVNPLQEDPNAVQTIG